MESNTKNGNTTARLREEVATPSPLPSPPTNGIQLDPAWTRRPDNDAANRPSTEIPKPGEGKLLLKNMRNALGGLFLGAQDINVENIDSAPAQTTPDPTDLNVQVPRPPIGGTSPAVNPNRPKSEAVALGGAFAKGLKGMLLGGTSPAPGNDSQQENNKLGLTKQAQLRRGTVTPNAKLQEQLANLIKLYGKKGKDNQSAKSEVDGQSNTSGKSKNILLFESAFKKRLAATKIGNKSANEVILAAMEAEYRAKREYQKKRRASILAAQQEQGLAQSTDGDAASEASIKQGGKTARQLRIEKLASQRWWANIIDNNYVVVLMTLITIYALFFDDIRMILLPKDLDDIFYGITLFGIFAYTFEILIASYSKNEYLYSFFFWLDIVSTVSMIPDCGWIWDPMIGDASANADDATSLAKSSRASRVIRVIRIIRLIRLIRIVKLYKQQQIAKRKHFEEMRRTEDEDKKKQGNMIKKVHPGADSEDSEDFDAQYLFDEESEEEEYKIPEESKISRTLSDKTLKSVVSLVLLLLFLLPVVTADTYISPTYVHEQALKQLVAVYNLGSGYKDEYEKSLNLFLRRTRAHSSSEFPLVYLKTPNASGKDEIREFEPSLKTLRKDEYQSVTQVAKNGFEFIAAYSTKSYTKVESILNIMRTTVVVVILSLSSISFTKDAQEMVLDPLERMIEKVKMISKNPLIATSEEVHEAGIMSFFDHEEKKNNEENQAVDEQYETAVLERAIVKIGHLLALGFGEAGSRIIAANMKQTGEMNALMPGERTYAIFGFCILDDFVESTEVLQTDIMTYVNQVAEITHSMVDRYGGAPNKNIGEAFVLVWKFADPEEIEEMDDAGSFNNTRLSLKNQVIADMAVFSFIKIIAKLNKFEHILQYAENEKMKKHISEDFRVRMGFGLHQGWAIEGAIGSLFKVDASYLSPNVNMAARLEAATKMFGTHLLISGQLRDLMSTQFQKVCREIDTVTVKGSNQPIRLYTIDLETDGLQPEVDPMINLSIREKKQVRDELRKDLFKKLNSGELTTWQEISRDEDFKEMRRNSDIKFEFSFSVAYKAYLAGNWNKAGAEFTKLHKQRPKDGPTRNLYNIIVEENNCVTPSWWKGFRPLTRKT